LHSNRLHGSFPFSVYHLLVMTKIYHIFYICNIYANQYHIANYNYLFKIDMVSASLEAYRIRQIGYLSKNLDTLFDPPCFICYKS
jgi:hypothetical protein